MSSCHPPDTKPVLQHCGPLTPCFSKLHVPLGPQRRHFYKIAAVALRMSLGYPANASTVETWHDTSS